MASSVWIGGDTPVAVAELQINDGGTKRFRLIESGGSLLLQQADQGGAFSTVGTFTSGGVFTAPSLTASSGNVTTGSGSGFESANGGGIGIPTHPVFRFHNNGSTNTSDITLADWGTTLSAEGVSVADAGTLNIGAAPLGLLTITVGTDNIVGRFQLRGSSNAVVADDGNDAIFTTTKDTANSINVYFDTNAYFIQNTRGGARTLRSVLTGA